MELGKWPKIRLNDCLYKIVLELLFSLHAKSKILELVIFVEMIRPACIFWFNNTFVTMTDLKIFLTEEKKMVAYCT